VESGMTKRIAFDEKFDVYGGHKLTTMLIVTYMFSVILLEICITKI
jgi:hypothetical protein